jgi:Uma2 family endonuclease
MKTALKFGPKDRGRELSYDEFLAARYREGYRYELIDGRLTVAPIPNRSHEDLVDWLAELFQVYRRACPQVVNKISSPARVFVPNRPGTTCPEPDIAAYQDYPYHLPRHERHWEDPGPVLVVEVVSDADPEKDFRRNVGLYAAVPSIQEYWVMDSRVTDKDLTLRVYRRGRGRRWRRPIDIPFGETYTTPLLPGFSLPVDPNARP